MTIGPDAVAKVIEKALTAKHPQARYAVPAAAHGLIGARSVLPGRAWDALMRTAMR